ncbi:hypothetical protein PO909_025017, partial [Leuciscus waleckii]
MLRSLKSHDISRGQTKIAHACSYFLAHFLMGGKYILWAGKAETGEVTFPPYDVIRMRFKISAFEP